MGNSTYGPNSISNILSCSTLPDFLTEMTLVIVTINMLKVVRNKKIEIFSHRYLMEFYETNRMSHVPHLYDVINLLK